MAIRNVDPESIAPTATGPWINWAWTQLTAPRGVFRPTSLHDLVATVVRAERERAMLRPLGSGWSFTAVGAPIVYAVDFSCLKHPIPTNMTELVRPDLLEAGSYVHVQAGIKLYDLNKTLWDDLKALATLGGSQGQTLAGAIMTGTHGGDFDRPPIADAVRAIHLVTIGGREYWIEPSEGLSQGYELPIPDWDDSIRVVRDDELFDAVLVSMGRFGIAYSYVLQVQPHYFLEEQRYNAIWAGQVGGTLEVARHELERAARFGFSHVFGQMSPLGAPGPARYLQIDLDPNSNAAYVTKRWTTTNDERVEPPAPAKTFAEDAHTVRSLAEALRYVPPQVAATGPGHGELMGELVRIGMSAAFGGERVPQKIRDRSYYIMSGSPDPYETYPAKYLAHNQDALRVDSAEFFFNACDTAYLDFVDALLEKWGTFRMWKAGYISLRFMGRSRATLGMQHWNTTVSIEYTTLKVFPGTEGLMYAAYMIATKHGAVFHWGQNQPSHHPGLIESRFGDRLDRWRRQLARIGAAPGDVFDGPYFIMHGLEPVGAPDPRRPPESLLLLLAPA